ncbi:MAG: hypothetical protein LBF17_01380 [Mediterranea sp.]|nr:hypothetical protein [Mediterranea sp.]
MFLFWIICLLDPSSLCPEPGTVLPKERTARTVSIFIYTGYWGTGNDRLPHRKASESVVL